MADNGRVNFDYEMRCAFRKDEIPDDELADRAVTVFQGRINGEFSREEITQDALTSASFGIAHERKV